MIIKRIKQEPAPPPDLIQLTLTLGEAQALRDFVTLFQGSVATPTIRDAVSVLRQLSLEPPFCA
jgi:hypothetical protein